MRAIQLKIITLCGTPVIEKAVLEVEICTGGLLCFSHNTAGISPSLAFRHVLTPGFAEARQSSAQPQQPAVKILLWLLLILQLSGLCRVTIFFPHLFLYRAKFPCESISEVFPFSIHGVKKEKERTYVKKIKKLELCILEKDKAEGLLCHGLRLLCFCYSVTYICAYMSQNAARQIKKLNVFFSFNCFCI